MEAFNETLPPLPLEAIDEQTIQQDLQAWQDNPPDPDFTKILTSPLAPD